MYAVIEMKLNRTTPNLNPAFDLDKLIGLSDYIKKTN